MIKIKKESCKKKTEYSRRFSEEETKLFCSVLADPDDCFLSTLEKLALKSSENLGQNKFECFTLQTKMLLKTSSFHTGYPDFLLLISPFFFSSHV